MSLNLTDSFKFTMSILYHFDKGKNTNPSYLYIAYLSLLFFSITFFCQYFFCAYIYLGILFMCCYASFYSEMHVLKLNELGWAFLDAIWHLRKTAFFVFYIPLFSSYEILKSFINNLTFVKI